MEFFSVILSGGAGTRLWPISRIDKPKQFSPIFEPNLFEQTVDRLKDLGKILVVTSHHLKNVTIDSLKNLQTDTPLVASKNIILEPEPKGTAHSALLAALTLEKQGFKDSVMGIFPADHLIENQKSFCDNIKLGIQTAKNNNLITFGITPTHASCEYGYIKHEGSNIADVIEFVEKPSKEMAQKYIKSNYLWNSGIFIIRVKNLIELFKTFDPKTHDILREADLSSLDEVYKKLSTQSFDVAIAEKAKDTKVIVCDLGWRDVGNINQWSSNYTSGVSATGGVSVNPLIEHEASNNSFFSSNTDKLSVFLGTNNLTIMDSPDALLVSDKDEMHKLKQVYKKISNTKYAYTDTVKRPWGEFEKVRSTPFFAIKIIKVNPGCRLSYQSHKKRSEHWTVVKGAGKVTLDGKDITLNVGDHVFIPVLTKHRIENVKRSILEFVEVQLGEYFGEDDIVRYEDDYGRVKK